VTPQRLDRTLTCFRIGDPSGQFPIFDATGSALFPGRWNDATTPVIYASRSYATAMLEKLVHAAGRLPPNQHFVTVTLPRGLSYEALPPGGLPGWNGADERPARGFGVAWWRARRSAVLLVPSVVAPMEENVLIHPQHPEFATIEHDLPRPVPWDARLFPRQ
jgi:RES domain-containing protein